MNLGKIRTEDYILQKSKKGNFYIVDNQTGQNVMVAPTVASQWDTLDTVTVGERKFTKQTNPDTGELEDKEWSRLEITGKGSVAATYEKKSRNLEAVVKYETLKKQLTEASQLSPEIVKEINSVLNY